MDRRCMRPGCGRPAVARLSYDPVACQVWLDPVPERPGPAQEICELHTSRLTVPRGWMLCDRRGVAPALFVTDPAEADTTRPRTRPAASAAQPHRARSARGDRASGTSPAPTPELFDTDPAPAGEPPAEVGASPDSEPASSPEPVLDSEPAAEAEPEAEPTPTPAPIAHAPAPNGAPRVNGSDGGAGSDRADAPRRAVERRVAQVVPVEIVPEEQPSAVPAAAKRTVQVSTTVERSRRSRAGDADEVDHVIETVEYEAARVEVEVEAAPSTASGAEAEPGPDEVELPTSPLLARAFRANGPQRSVLTHTLLNETD